MTNLPEHIIIKETSRTSRRYVIDETTFCGTFSEIKKELDELEREGWEGVECKGVGHDGAVEYNLYRYRPETNEERDKRLTALSKKTQKDAIAKEVRRSRYEALRKEFGSD